MLQSAAGMVGEGWFRRAVTAAVVMTVGCVQTAPSTAAIEDLVQARGPTEAAWLYETDVDQVLAPERAGAMLIKLRAAHKEVAGLSVVAKAVLQNDVWGFMQRIEQSTVESEARSALLKAAKALVDALAPSAEELETLRGRSVPGFLDEYKEHDTEHVSLQHERIFGYRRLFRIFLRGDAERALVSQLVVVDKAQRPHLTAVVGEVEMLTFSPTEASVQWVLTKARVFKRDRAQLTAKNGPPLVETRSVAHVPDLGANGFLAEFSWPERSLDGLPCLQCHDTALMMSLPTLKTDPTERHRRLLTEFTRFSASP